MSVSNNAGEKNSSIRFNYQFGESTVALSCAGERLAARVPFAFHHLLKDSQSRPQLNVQLFSSRKKDRNSDDFLRAADWSFEFEGGTVTGTRDGRYLSYRRQWTEQRLDRANGELMVWYDEDVEIPIFERSKPLSLPLSVWYNDQGIQIVHAGLVALDHSGILIAGPAGSGKTTVTLACAAEGYGFLGDDYVGLQSRPDRSFMGYSLYNSVRLHRSSSDHFSWVLPNAEIDPNGQEKLLLFVSRVFPETIQQQIPIRLVLFPRISGSGQTRVYPLEKGKALLRFGYSSLQIPSAGPAFGLQRLSQLLQTVPCFWLELGQDISQIPACISNVLKEVAKP